MMTLTELQGAKINEGVAREAYNQAAKRLEDTIDTKKSYEQKAFTLFTGYVTVSLALFGAGGVFYKDHGLDHLVFPFWLAGAFFVIGTVFFVIALIDRSYGALASEPSMWLVDGTINGGDDVLPLMLAYITYHHQNRIKVSVKSNAKKAWRIRVGIILGTLAPFVLLLAFFLPAMALDTALKAFFH